LLGKLTGGGGGRQVVEEDIFPIFPGENIEEEV
jgi:hypothetical protein